jgi:AraC-like DNA-binding protein
MIVEEKRFWRVPEGGGAELLDATFVDHAYGRHSHDRYVLAVITRGAEQWYYRGSRHVAGPGQILILNPDEIHDGCAAAEEGWSYRVFYLPPEALADAAGAGRDGRPAVLPYFPEVIVNDRELASRIVRLHRLLEGGESDLERQSLTALVLRDLVARHAKSGRDAPALRRCDPAIARVREFIDSAFAEPLSLDQLAAIAGLSPLYLIRAFRAATGLPPHAYQIQRRLQEAARLLRAGGEIAEVAAACGFSDQSHLTRHFKRMTGITPARFRSGSFKTPVPQSA